jgi:hypothetical protein
VFDEPEVLGCHPILHNGGFVDRSVTPIDKPFSGRHIQSLLLENRQYPAQGLHNVVGIDRFAPGYIVDVDEPLVVEERKDHQFAPGDMDLSLDRSKLDLLGTQLRLLLGFRCMEANCRLVNRSMESSIAIEWRQTIAKNSSQVQILSSLFALVSSFGTHLSDFFDRSRSLCLVSWINRMHTAWRAVSF